MKQDDRFRISFLHYKSVDKIFRSLMNDEFIRNNVDSFFLYTSNYQLLSQFIFEKKAIAYSLKEISSGQCLGVFFAFRIDDYLYGHFFFSKHHRVDICQTIAEMIRLMCQYFKKKGILILAFIGQIPEKNKAAIWVTRKLGAKYNGFFYTKNNAKIVEYILPI